MAYGDTWYADDGDRGFFIKTKARKSRSFSGEERDAIVATFHTAKDRDFTLACIKKASGFKDSA